MPERTLPPGLTATGIAIGTQHYMSPEQIMTPNRVDGRADIYSLGIVLYELLAGREPFDAGSDFSVLQAHVFQPPRPLRAIDPSIPPELEAVVMRALNKNPDERYADCDSMMRAIDLVAEGQVALPIGPMVQQSVFLERTPLPSDRAGHRLAISATRSAAPFSDGSWPQPP